MHEYILSTVSVLSSLILSLFNLENEMMEVEEKSTDGKTVVDEQKDEDEAKTSEVVDRANNEMKQKDKNDNKQEKKINKENAQKEKIEDKKKKKDNSPERVVKKEKGTEDEGGSAKKKPISSFFGKSFFPILSLFLFSFFFCILIKRIVHPKMNIYIIDSPT